MIKINLGKRKGASGGDDGGRGPSAGLGDFVQSLKDKFSRGAPAPQSDEGDFETEKSSLQSLRQSPLLKIAIAGLACFLAQDYFHNMENEELAKVETKLKSQEQEQSKLEKKFAEVRGYEAEKQRLEEDDKIIRTKLHILMKIQSDRSATTKVLLQIAQAIPKDVWLTELKTVNDTVAIAGATPSYASVSGFLKNLSDSSQLKDILLKSIEENPSVSKEVSVQAFNIEAMKRRLD